MLHKKIYFISSAILVLASSPGVIFANVNNAPQPVTCIHSSFSNPVGSYWQNVTLTLTNNCQTAIDLKDSFVKFHTTSNITNVWGVFSKLATPQITLSRQADTLSIHLVFPEDTKWWHPNAKLAQGDSIALKYGVPKVGYDPNSVKVYTDQAPPVGKGNIDLQNESAAPAGSTEKPIIDIKNATTGQEVKTIRLDWHGAAVVSDLPAGEYTIDPENVSAGSDIYQGTANPEQVTVSDGKDSHSTVTYHKNVPSKTEKIDVQNTTTPPSNTSNEASPYVDIIDTKNHVVQKLPVAWQSSGTSTDLPVGQYTIKPENFNYGGDVYVGVANPSTVSPPEAGHHAKTKVVYTKTKPPTTGSIDLNNKTAKPAGATKAPLIDIDSASSNKIVKKISLPWNGQAVASQLPAGQYTIVPEDYTTSSEAYSGEASPSQVTVSGTKAVGSTITYHGSTPIPTGKILPSNPNIQYTGRWYDDGGNKVTSFGNAIRIKISNTSSLQMLFDNSGIGTYGMEYEYRLYPVGDTPPNMTKIHETTGGVPTITLGAAGSEHLDPKKTYVLEFHHIAEASYGQVIFKGFQASSDAVLHPLTRSALKFEFIGDSITAAWKADYQGSGDAGDVKFENADHSFATLLANMFESDDFSTVARSGIGVEKIVDLPMIQVYPYETFNSPWSPKTKPWDFSSWQPNIIIIALGTNDANAGISKDSWENEFTDLIHFVRSKNPNAIIFCMDTLVVTTKGAPTQWTDTSNDIKAVVQKAQSGGDKNVFFLGTGPRDGGYYPVHNVAWLTDGAVDYAGDRTHPTALGHQKLADHLCTELLNNKSVQALVSAKGVKVTCPKPPSDH